MLLLLFTFVACVKRSDDVSPIEEAKSETTVSKTEVRGNIQETDKAAAIEVVDDTGCLTADQLMASSQFFSEYVLETSVKASDRKWLFHISNVVLKHDDEILCAVFQDHGGLANTESHRPGQAQADKRASELSRGQRRKHYDNGVCLFPTGGFRKGSL